MVLTNRSRSFKSECRGWVWEMVTPTMRLFAFVLLFAPGYSAFTLSTHALREYELKHGRVAMAAVPTLVGLSAAGVDEPVRWLSQQSSDVQLMTFSLAALLEAGATLPRFEGLLELKEDVEPGRFPPLGPPSEEVQLAELAIARASMLVAFGCLLSIFG